MDDTVSACKDLQQAVKIKKKIHIQRGKDGVKLPRWPFLQSLGSFSGEGIRQCLACVAGLGSLIGDVAHCVLTGSFPVNAPSEPVSLSRRILISSCSSFSLCSPETHGNHIAKALQTCLMPMADLRLSLPLVE